MADTPHTTDVGAAAGGWESDVAASMRYCREVVRCRASSFFHGMKLTPEPKRSAIYALYAFMRACDDLVDAPVAGAGGGETTGDTPATAVSARLDTLRRQVQAVCAGAPVPPGLARHDPLWPALRHIVQTYSIDPALFGTMFDGHERDLSRCRFQTFAELYEYCYSVASVVGLVCLRVWGAGDDPAALKLAEYRGVALQLTNILRDLVEDARRGRVYLPQEDLDRFGFDAATILNPSPPAESFTALMAFQVERARDYYRRSALLEDQIDPGCRAASWAIMEIYRRLLEKIARRPGRVLERRVRVSTPGQMGIVLRAVLRNRWAYPAS